MLYIQKTEFKNSEGYGVQPLIAIQALCQTFSLGFALLLMLSFEFLHGLGG